MKPRHTLEEFCRAWQDALSPNEAANALGYSVGYVVSKASRLRRQGVNLKCFHKVPHPRARRPVPVERLNLILTEEK